MLAELVRRQPVSAGSNPAGSFETFIIKKELGDNMKQLIAKTIAKHTKLKEDVVIKLLEVPPQGLGDYAFPCFILSKKLKKTPQDIAKSLANKIKLPKDIEKVEFKGSYLNFFVNKDLFSKDVVKKIDKNYGKGKGKTKLMVEFAHPNTHKGLHIGHVRNICIGEALSRILKYYGHKVYKTNYQGDVGPHIGKCLWGYINLYNKKAPKKNKGVWLGKVYAEASKKINENKEFEDQAKDITKKLYEKDKEIIKIWKETKKWSLDYFDDIYKDLGTSFDKLYFESNVADGSIKISKELFKKGLAVKMEGSITIDLDKYGLGKFILLNKEGLPLYYAKDLELVEQEFSDFKIDKCIHVVATPQEHYFKQLFKVFEVIGSSGAGKSYHLSYGLVSLKEGKMSSRVGNVVLYDELKEKMIKALKKLKPDLDKDVVKKIVFGAMKYSMLKMSSEKKIMFDWNEALKLEGNSGPYLQYACVRAKRILEKSKKKPKFKSIEKEVEFKLVKKLADFPNIVEKAALEYKPHLISTYSFELAQQFSEFYEKCKVINAKNEESKLALVKAFIIVLEKALYLLGIKVPNKM